MVEVNDLLKYGLLLLFAPCHVSNQLPHHSAQRLNAAFWNVQNLFDPDISPLAAEFDYTAVSGWDRRATQSRIARLSQVISAMFDGQGPDLLGLAEVENHRLAARLIQETGREDLRLVTPDEESLEACNTVLIYSSRQLELSGSIRAWNINPQYSVCDILEATFRVNGNGAEITVLINDWPGRGAGPAGLRHAAAAHCSRIVDRHLKLPRSDYLQLGHTDSSAHRLNQLWNRNLLLMGDFSDEPWDVSLRDILSANYADRPMTTAVPGVGARLPSWKSYAAIRPALFNPTWTALNGPDSGTVMCPTRIGGACALYDQMIVSGGLRQGLSGLRLVPPDQTAGVLQPLVRIFRPDFMTGSDGAPLHYECETGTGYSNHFPILTSLELTAT